MKIKKETLFSALVAAHTGLSLTNDEQWVDGISQAELNYHYQQIINKVSDLSANRRKLVVERFDQSKK